MIEFNGLAMYGTVEDLPVEYRDYAYIHPTIGMVFNHPFLIQTLTVTVPGNIETYIKKRTEAAKEALEEKKYSEYLFSHERPYRLSALHDLANSGKFDDDPSVYWALLNNFWVDSELDETDEIWELVLDDLPTGFADYQSAFTTEEDRKTLSEMPDMITVYRGIQVEDGSDEYDISEAANEGHSWTTSVKTAEFFARRLKGSNVGYIVQATVDKASVIAYINTRNEYEIVLSKWTVGDNYEVIKTL